MKPAKGGSRFWALLQNLQEEDRPSKTQRYAEGSLLDPPVPEWVGRSVSGNGCAPPPTNLEFHVPTSGQRSTTSCRNRAGNSNPLPASSLRRQRGHGSTMSNVGCCSEKRSWVAGKKACTGTSTAVESQQTTENCLWKSDFFAKSANNTFDKSCWAASSCASKQSNELMLLREAASV